MDTEGRATSRALGHSRRESLLFYEKVAILTLFSARRRNGIYREWPQGKEDPWLTHTKDNLHSWENPLLWYNSKVGCFVVDVTRGVRAISPLFLIFPSHSYPFLSFPSILKTYHKTKDMIFFCNIVGMGPSYRNPIRQFPQILSRRASVLGFLWRIVGSPYRI